MICISGLPLRAVTSDAAPRSRDRRRYVSAGSDGPAQAL